MNRKSLTMFLFVAVLTVAAGFGHLFGQVPAARPQQQDAEAALRQFMSLLDVVEDNYATTVEPDTAVYGAIAGMLRTLDPHSHFYDPKSFQQMREDQQGRYERKNPQDPVQSKLHEVRIYSDYLAPAARSTSEAAG